MASGASGGTLQESASIVKTNSINRRNFLKAAGAGIILPAVVPGCLLVRHGTVTFSKRSLVRLTKPGQSAAFADLPAATRLAIRYGSVTNGTISVAVDGQPARKVNVHSSGVLTNRVLHAIIDVAIPAGATVTIGLATDDIAVDIDQLVAGDGDLGLPPDIWNLPPLSVASGPYAPDWRAISRRYTVPEWWRDAKFGAWAHWDPQSMPEDGDWYARGMYQEGSGQYDYHVQHFGYPSVYGYKDICRNWVIDRWNPHELMALYVEMGARYFMAMGAHHDNFDCYDSKYQPWNSVNVGPKVDVVGTWEKVARKYGMRFGIGFHNTPGRTWGQFMPVRYTSDRRGPMQGRALRRAADDSGRIWQMDSGGHRGAGAAGGAANRRGRPRQMVARHGPGGPLRAAARHARGPRRPENDPLLSPFANQFMWRVDDAISKYRPDVIYFDEHAGDSQVDLGVHMGLGFLAPTLAANYYNKSLQWNRGKMDVVLNLKGVGGRYNSFQDRPDLLPFVDRSLVKSTEAIVEPQITPYSFQTEVTSGTWHYQTGQKYMDARSVIRTLMQNVSRNGSLLLNISMHGRGDLDPQAIQMCKDVGAWLRANGESVYASRPFEVSEEDSGAVCYTRNNGNVYATLLNWDGGPITLKALARRRGDVGQRVQSRTARLGCCADVCARRPRADGHAPRHGAAAGRHRQSIACDDVPGLARDP